jgi:Undecaprenyl-phosphate glucose phosphotransferase
MRNRLRFRQARGPRGRSAAVGVGRANRREARTFRRRTRHPRPTCDPEHMTTDATVRSAADAPPFSRVQNTQVFWTAAAAFVEVVAISASTYAAFAVYNLAVYGVIPDRIAYAWASAGMGVVYGALCLADNQYDLLGAEWNEQSRSRGLAAVVLAVVMLLALGYIVNNLEGYSRGTFLAQLFCAALAQIVTRAVLWRIIDQARRNGNWQRASTAVLIMPGADHAADMPERLSTRYQNIVRCYDVGAEKPAALDAFEAQLAGIRDECRQLRIDAVLIVFDADNMAYVTRTVSAVSELPVRIQLLPVGMTDFMRRSRIANCGRFRVLELFSGPSLLRDRVLKRGMDVGAALALIVLLAPLLAMVAMLIKLDSRGPVLFRQKRHGFNNEPIQVLKFRSMTTFQDSRDEFRQAVRNDPRVTRIGRIIRRTNIDELPQLFNVLWGDMSMVGPRPHAVAHNDMYADQIRSMSRRHNVKPGITGWAQVNGLRGETDTIEKMRKRVEYDLYYIDNWSFVFDLKIMVMTLLSKNSYENAY